MCVGLTTNIKDKRAAVRREEALQLRRSSLDVAQVGMWGKAAAGRAVTE